MRCREVHLPWAPQCAKHNDSRDQRYLRAVLRGAPHAARRSQQPAALARYFPAWATVACVGLAEARISLDLYTSAANCLANWGLRAAFRVFFATCDLQLSPGGGGVVGGSGGDISSRSWS
jgi:hypothetical protein